MRTDMTLDGRQVRCPHASLIGYSSNMARVGYFFTYVEDGQIRYARMLARIAYAPRIGNDNVIKNYILALVLSMNASSAYERWVDPATVREVYEKPPTKLTTFFFQPTLPYKVDVIRRLIEHGSLQELYVDKVEERVEMFRSRGVVPANTNVRCACCGLEAETSPGKCPQCGTVDQFYNVE
jgi:predicted Zn-ribbon and HTH transcriptional regulator